jgi:hypothetical protein
MENQLDINANHQAPPIRLILLISMDNLQKLAKNLSS